MDLLVVGAASLGIHLDAAQIEQFELYYRELLDWNRKTNLTTVTDREQVQTRHFLDSLVVHSVLPAGAVPNDARMIDIGSGAGFPGLPLRIAFPQVRLTLVDSVRKRTAFLHHIIEALGFDDVEVRLGRAEDLGREPRLREGFDVVLARAVAKLPVLAELMLPFCRVGGLVVTHKGADAEDQVREAQRAVSETGGKLKEVRRVDLDRNGFTTSLVVIEKVTETPDRYPRRPGIPAKRPL